MPGVQGWGKAPSFPGQSPHRPPGTEGSWAARREFSPKEGGPFLFFQKKVFCNTGGKEKTTYEVWSELTRKEWEQDLFELMGLLKAQVDKDKFL